MTTQQAITIAVPPETLGDRMRRALRKEHISVHEIADYLGVSRNTVSTWINDRIYPSEQTLKLWAIRTGVPERWLKEGDASMSPFPAGSMSQADTPLTRQLDRSWSVTQDDFWLAA